MSIEVSYKLFCLVTGHVAGGRPKRHRGGRRDRNPEAPCRNWASRMDRIKPTRPKAVLPHSQQEIGGCPLLPATARGICQVCQMPRTVRTRERLSPYGTFVAMRKPVASGCQQMPKPSGFRG